MLWSRGHRIDMDNLSREQLLGYIKKQKARIKQLETENDFIVKEKDGLKSVNDKLACEHDLLKASYSQLIQENEEYVKSYDRFKYESEIVNEKLQTIQKERETEISHSDISSQFDVPAANYNVTTSATDNFDSPVNVKPIMSIWDGLRFSHDHKHSFTNSTNTNENTNNNSHNSVNNEQANQELIFRLSKASLVHFIRLLDHSIDQQTHHITSVSSCFYQWKTKALIKTLQSTESSYQALQESSKQTIEQLESSLERTKESSKETILQLEAKIHKLKALLARTHQSKQVGRYVGW